MLNPTFLIPKKIKGVLYNPSPNTYTISVSVKNPPQVKWSQETLTELSDKKHLNAIKKARLEYKQGKLVNEEEIFLKLKK